MDAIFEECRNFPAAPAEAKENHEAKIVAMIKALPADVNINALDPATGYGVIHYAASYAMVSLLTAILQAGCDVNLRPSN